MISSRLLIDEIMLGVDERIAILSRGGPNSQSLRSCLEKFVCIKTKANLKSEKLSLNSSQAIKWFNFVENLLRSWLLDPQPKKLDVINTPWDIARHTQGKYQTPYVQ